MDNVGLYVGSFDPVTRGHIDILGKSVLTFHRIYVAVGVNPNKTGFFDIETRESLIRSAIQECDDSNVKLAYQRGRIVVGSYKGLSLIQYARKVEATHIVRGLRQIGDFNDEFALTGIAGHLDNSLIFTHFICREEFLHVSSSTARELSSLKENIEWLVTPSVEKALREKSHGL